MYMYPFSLQFVKAQLHFDKDYKNILYLFIKAQLEYPLFTINSH